MEYSVWFGNTHTVQEHGSYQTIKLIPSDISGCMTLSLLLAQAVQQLPEYGMLFHHAACQKMLSAAELLLGVCAKGITVYEVKNNIHTMKLQFPWRETVNIFAAVSAL